MTNSRCWKKLSNRNFKIYFESPKNHLKNFFRISSVTSIFAWKYTSFWSIPYPNILELVAVAVPNRNSPLVMCHLQLKIRQTHSLLTIIHKWKPEVERNKNPLSLLATIFALFSWHNFWWLFEWLAITAITPIRTFILMLMLFSAQTAINWRFVACISSLLYNSKEIKCFLYKSNEKNHPKHV